ncbi:MAG: MATE family efflux transporter [Candidatus Nanopelagicales bacterium]
MTTEGLDRGIARLAIPAFGALLAQPLFLLVDAAIVGTLGTAQLAGLGAASTIFGTVVGLCIFLSYAATAAVARLLGAGDRAGALSQGVDGMALGVGLGVVIGAVTFAFAEPLITALGTSGEVTPYAVTYLRIVAISFPAVLGVLAAVGVLRGLQDTRTTLYVTIVMVVVNLVLDIVFIFGFGWGIGGSAAATGLAELTGLLAYGFILLRNARRARVTIVPSGVGVIRAARDGVPLFVRSAALRGVLVIAAAVAARLGDQELAAYHVTVTLFFALALALDAVAIAGQALTGKSLGSGEVAQSRVIARRIVWWSVWLGVGLTVIILALRPWLPQWYGDDAQVSALISSALLVLALLQPMAGIVFALDGVLIGAGDTRWLAWAQVAVFLAFLPAAWLVLVGDGDVADLWWALGWFLLVRTVLVVWRARGSAWLITGATRPR